MILGEVLCRRQKWHKKEASLKAKARYELDHPKKKKIQPNSFYNELDYR